MNQYSVRLSLENGQEHASALRPYYGILFLYARHCHLGKGHSGTIGTFIRR